MAAFVHVIEFAAVISGALFGILLARRKRMDIVGVFSVAFILAFGGGTLRDLFLDRNPLFWIRHEAFPITVFGLVLASSLVPRFPRWTGKILFLPDALGLGLFSILGASFALEAGTSWFVASLLGVVTGTFGGVMGEVICNEVPSLFTSAPLYATCSFVGCWVYLLAIGLFHVEAATAMLAGATVVVLVRIAAVHWDWRFGPQGLE